MSRSGRNWSSRGFSSLPGEDDGEFSSTHDVDLPSGDDALFLPDNSPQGHQRRARSSKRSLLSSRNARLTGVLLAFCAICLAVWELVMFVTRPPTGLWSKQGKLTVGRNTPFHLKGVSWYGMEHELHCLEGLAVNSMANILDRIAEINVNAIRVPLALDSFNRNPRMGSGVISTFANSDIVGSSYRQLLGHLIDKAAERNILVLLDLHRLNAKVWPGDGLWYSDEVPVSNVISFWKELALLHRKKWNVLGADLFNEPYGAKNWSSWKSFVESAGNEIHAIAPSWLIVAEGVGNLPDEPRPEEVFWAENLHASSAEPPGLGIQEKLALSPHVYGTTGCAKRSALWLGHASEIFMYLPAVEGESMDILTNVFYSFIVLRSTGPSVHNQSYFSARNFPSNMPGIWDDHFGNASASGAAVIVGEFGGTAVGPDLDWQNAFVSYITRKGMGYFYWCLNPGSADTGGLFQNDNWKSLDAKKVRILAQSPSTPVSSVRKHFKLGVWRR